MWIKMKVLDGVTEIIFNISLVQQTLFNVSFMSYILCRQRVKTEPQSSQLTSNSWTDKRVAEIKKKYDTPKKPFGHHCRNKTLQNVQGRETVVRTEGKDQLGQRWQAFRKNGFSHQSLDKQNIQLVKQQPTTKFNIGRSSEKRLDQKFDASLTKFDRFYMKSSLKGRFNGQVSHKNSCTLENKSSHSPQFIIQDRKRVSENKIPRHELHGRRIDNIDKINSKIKKILYCIDQCEQDFAKQEEIIFQDSRMRNNEGVNNSINERRSTEYNEIVQSNDELLQTTIINKQKIYYLCDQPIKIYRPSLPNQEFMRDSRKRTMQNSNHFEQYLISYKNCLDEQQALNHHSKCFTRDEIQHKDTHYQTPIKREDPSLNSHKKKSIQKEGEIDDKMNRLQQKIVSLEQKKKNLNIEFKPFNFAHSPLRKNTGQDHRTPNATPNAQLKIRASQIRGEVIKDNNIFMHSEAKHIMNSFIENLDYKNSIKQQNHILTNNCGSYTKKFTFSDLTKEQMEFQSSKQPVFTNPFQKEIKIVSPQKRDVSNPAPSKPSFDNEQLRRKIGERMQERKKRMQVFHDQRGVPKIETAKLVAALIEQVKLDQELRNSKNWFRECHSFDKLQTLRRLLRNEGLDLSEHQIQEELGLTQEEIDPFFSFREQKYNFKAVVVHYVQSRHHWDSIILNKWDTDELIQKEQLSSKLDGQQKGYIQIQDLVRLLNTQSKTFYRNRDLFLVYERLRQGSQRITIELLRNILGRPKQYL